MVIFGRRMAPLVPWSTLKAALGPDFISSIRRQIARLRSKWRSGGSTVTIGKPTFAGKHFGGPTPPRAVRNLSFHAKRERIGSCKPFSAEVHLLVPGVGRMDPPGGGLNWGQKSQAASTFRTLGRHIPVAFVGAACELRVNPRKTGLEPPWACMVHRRAPWNLL